MNMHNQELLRQHQQHAAIRARLMRPQCSQKPTPDPVKDIQPVRYMAKQIPLWSRQDIHFDSHVRDWQWEVAQRRASEPRKYLWQRCAELNMTLAVMTGPSQIREVAWRRYLVALEIYRRYGLSLPQIGRMLGNRDHTTILYGIRKIEAMTEEQRAEINTPLVAKGVRQRNTRKTT